MFVARAIFQIGDLPSVLWLCFVSTYVVTFLRKPFLIFNSRFKFFARKKWQRYERLTFLLQSFAYIQVDFETCLTLCVIFWGCVIFCSWILTEKINAIKNLRWEQGCQIYLGTTNQKGENIPTSSNVRPSKINPNLDFWFGNTTSGNRLESFWD
jgi:hypothetical protein